MDRRFRGPTPEKTIKTPNIRIAEKDLKKIKVEITRNVPNTENQVKELDHSLDRPEEIKIYRCQGEGRRPIFERDGIKVNMEDVELKTISSESPPRTHRTNSDSQRRRDYGQKSSDYSKNSRESPRRSRDRDSLNHSRISSNKPSTSRRGFDTHSRNRSRSRDRRSRRSRSRSRSSRREFGRRHNSRSPNDRSYRYERKDYGRDRRDRRHGRSRSPRYMRSPPRGHGSSRDERHSTHIAPLDPATLRAMPLFIPPNINFYGPEDTLWFQTSIRGPPPMMFPRGFIPPRGMYRPPVHGMRHPMPLHPPSQLPQYNQIRGPPNRPPRVP